MGAFTDNAVLDVKRSFFIVRKISLVFMGPRSKKFVTNLLIHLFRREIFFVEKRLKMLIKLNNF